MTVEIFERRRLSRGSGKTEFSLLGILDIGENLQ